MDRITLDNLMLHIARGDEVAFEELYNQTKSGLYSFILSICKNHHLAEDVMQNTYIRIRLSANMYKAGSNTLAWIYTIAKNLTLNELNKQKHEMSIDFDDKGAKIGGQYTIDDKVSSPLLNVMKKVLNESEAQITSLHLISGFKHREIAEMLDKPLGTVLWTYKNALNKIKNNYSEEELAQILSQYGELDTTWKIASCIARARANEEIKTTAQLVKAVAPCTPKKDEAKFLTKLFQALRIEVNGEMEALKMALEQALKVLKPGGRLVVISYHSLEDRLVKNFMRSGNFEGKVEKDFFGRSTTPLRVITRKAIVPTAEEVEENPRSRSAKMRVAEKL